MVEVKRDRSLTDADVEAIVSRLNEFRPLPCDCVISEDDLRMLPEALRFFRNWNSIFSSASGIAGRTIVATVTLLLIAIFGVGVLGWLAEKLKGLGV